MVLPLTDDVNSFILLTFVDVNQVNQDILNFAIDGGFELNTVTFLK